MGNNQAISNLGYCYLYGRDTEQNTDLAVAYFQIATKYDNVDAAYKLGDIYGSNKWNKFDKEKSIYYYRMAASFIIKDEWESDFNIAYCDDFIKYPSLCFALGRELSVGGDMGTNVKCAYQFLKCAEYGYRIALQNGDAYYKDVYQNVLDMLEDVQYDDVRHQIDEIFEEDIY